MASDRLILTLLSHLCAASAIAPAFSELRPGLRLWLLAVIPVAILCDWRQWRIPAPLLTVAALGGTLAALSRFTWANPVAPFLEATAILLSIRLMTPKNRRNYLQLFTLSVFVLSAVSLMRLDLVYLASMAVLTTSGTVALVILTAQDFSTHLPGKQSTPRGLVRVGGWLVGASLPLMAVFFLMLPRTQTPLWRIIPQMTAGSGFSEQVHPGKSDSQQMSRRLAFRAEVPAELPPEDLYWRVTVLNRFTGTTWERTPPRHDNEPLAGGRGGEAPQTIYLEPGMGRYLVGLDRPMAITGLRFARAPDGVLTSPAAGSSRIRYMVRSRPHAESLLTDPAGVGESLELPDRAPARLTALGRGVRERHTEPTDRLGAIESLFQRQRLQYATTGLPTSPTPLDDFFQVSRRGNCEFFAGAAAVMLRAAGIPARLVGGYLGGDYSGMGGFYTLTDERAHVWVEALVDGRWQRVDPSRWAVNGRDLGRPAGPGLKARLLSLANLMDYYWTRTIVTYDFQQQLAAADRVGRALASLRQPVTLRRLLPWCAGVLLSLALCLAALRMRLPSREERLMRSIAGRLGPAAISPTRCLLDIARGCGDRRLRRIVELYAATVYRGRRLSRLRYRRLRRLLSG